MKKSIYLSSVILYVSALILLLLFLFFSRKNASYIIELTGNDISTVLDNSQKSIIILGYPECPWCEQAMPIFENALRKHNVKSYYINTKNEKNQIEFRSLRNQLQTYLTHTRLEKNFLVPCVFLLDDSGNIRDLHIGTLDEHNAVENELTTKQKKQLSLIYETLCIEFKQL